MRGARSSMCLVVTRVRAATLRVSMLDARIYRAALVPVLLAVIVCAFSLGDQPAPVGTTLAPDAFSGTRATRDVDALATAYPRRRAGSAADAALARRIAATFRGMEPAYEVSTPTFTGETIDGERRLTTVLARQIGEPGPELVVVAHRDAADRGAGAGLSGTPAMPELAPGGPGGRRPVGRGPSGRGPPRCSSWRGWSRAAGCAARSPSSRRAAAAAARRGRATSPSGSRATRSTPCSCSATSAAATRAGR